MLFLTMLLCLPLACDESGSASSPGLNLLEILPDEWQYVHTYRLDTNYDDKLEWVIVYRFDLSDKDELCNSPMAAFVYQLNDRKPPCIIPYELYPQGDPDRDYLCEYGCTVTMEDVLSGIPGPEIVVRDRREGEVTRLSIFHWEWDPERYRPRGFFSGDRITDDLDKVTVDRRLPGRAQLIQRCTYLPRDENKTYYENDIQDTLVDSECEIDFCQGEPENVVLSPYPEKIVLAFYNHYTDSEQTVSQYFTQVGWEQYVQRCAANRCGCTAARNEIAHVRVTHLQLVNEDCSPSPSHQCEDHGPNRALVQAIVVCERKDAVKDEETIVLWHVIRSGDRWKLDTADCPEGGS